MGHKGREATYRRVTNHYFWKGMYEDVANWIRACPECQRWAPKRYEEAHLYTEPLAEPFAKWHLDIQYMPAELEGKKSYLLEARDDLTGFVEAEVLNRKTAAAVETFVKRNILLRWGYPQVVVVDGGSEFKKEAAQILKDLQIPRVVISPYNSRANGVNEVGHISIAAALAKATDGTGKGWRALLPYVVFADRTTVRAVYGMSPFALVHNYEPVSPVENDIPTWRTVNWDSIEPCPEGHGQNEVRKRLVAVRAKLLWDSEHNFAVAAEKVAEARRKMADRRNQAQSGKFRPENAEIAEGDLVLVYNNVRQIDMSSNRKLQYRWDGPFRVRATKERNVYWL